jgi:CRP/FNR family transcriptional regulator
MNDALKILSTIPAFSGLTETQLAELERITSVIRRRRGEFIFSEGDEGSGFYIVMDGQVKVFKLSFEGKEQILHILGPGEPFGEVAVFAGRSFPANAEAISNCRLLFLPRSDFVALISQNPHMALSMLAVLSMRLRQFTTQIENLSLKEVPGRLASYLVLLAQEQDQPDSVSLPISKGQLASLLGTIPETLSRIFSKMSQQGLVQVSGSTILILDPGGLVELAQSGKLME